MTSGVDAFFFTAAGTTLLDGPAGCSAIIDASGVAGCSSPVAQLSGGPGFYDVYVLHVDQDFELIGSLTGQPVERLQV